MNIKIGTKLWRQDPSLSNRAGMAPFAEHTINAETPRSWIVNKDQWNEHKIDKQTLTEKGARGFGRINWFTKKSLDDHFWEQEHRHRIASQVAVADADTLKKVAALIGYKEKR